MKLRKSEIKEYKDFNSSAINSISIINSNQVKIVYNNSTKEYYFDIIDNNFVNLLNNIINNKESVGKFIHNSIKMNNIQQINTNVDKN